MVFCRKSQNKYEKLIYFLNFFVFILSTVILKQLMVCVVFILKKVRSVL